MSMRQDMLINAITKLRTLNAVREIADAETKDYLLARLTETKHAMNMMVTNRSTSAQRAFNSVSLAWFKDMNDPGLAESIINQLMLMVKLDDVVEHYVTTITAEGPQVLADYRDRQEIVFDALLCR